MAKGQCYQPNQRLQAMRRLKISSFYFFTTMDHSLKFRPTFLHKCEFIALLKTQEKGKPMRKDAANKDLTREELYASVKQLIDMEDQALIHLNQHKLFTLFSIGFQYLLYQSTKNPGAYIIRVEDSSLAEKLARKCKDASSRKFLQSLLVPRKLKYDKSTFYLDFFHFGSWGLTNEVPKEKAQVALVVKNTTSRPLDESVQTMESELGTFPEDYYLTSLTSFAKKTLLIAYDLEVSNFSPVQFAIIKKETDRTVSGVTLSKELSWDELED